MNADVMPDLVLPIQLLERRRVSRPEHLLLLAVLQQALCDLDRLDIGPLGTGYRIGEFRYRHARKAQWDLLAWFISDDVDSVTSFVAICEQLDLDPAPSARN